jgi:hypothetical protein
MCALSAFGYAGKLTTRCGRSTWSGSCRVASVQKLATWRATMYLLGLQAMVGRMTVLVDQLL